MATDTSAAQSSRYARVKAILAAAAGDHPSDYGEAGHFWNLPLEKFLKTRMCTVQRVHMLSTTTPLGQWHKAIQFPARLMPRRYA